MDLAPDHWACPAVLAGNDLSRSSDQQPWDQWARGSWELFEGEDSHELACCIHPGPLPEYLEGRPSRYKRASAVCLNQSIIEREVPATVS